MKALTYFINGNQCLTFMEEDEIDELKREQENTNISDLMERMFFQRNGLPFFYKNLKKNELNKKVSQIKEVDYSDYFFPTDKPRIGLTYLEHPIKGKFFIPIDNYDQNILEEKKGELIDILQSLGVKKIISRFECENTNKESEKIYEYVVRNKMITIEKKEECWDFDNSNINISNFNENEYIWLKNEPEWKEIVKILKKGGLKKGYVSFSTNISAISLGEFNEIISGKKSIKIKVYELEIEV